MLHSIKRAAHHNLHTNEIFGRTNTLFFKKVAQMSMTPGPRAQMNRKPNIDKKKKALENQ